MNPMYGRCSICESEGIKMKEIELVIKIPEKTINEIKDNAMFAGSISSDIRWDITSAIVNGIALPEGHGTLKDFEKLYADMSEREELARQRVIDTPSNSPCYMRYVAQLNERTSFKEMLYDASTIIEADKEQK